ncbi:unnamed protein product [Notodromas monacha]|uniref:Dihydropteridine reductase n=1 Tax=Notodromas monacha TaxID=399045 RepID=A0A7R9BF87_9CRUS|nr:unnamed protein product [Notodromas monacha]CAG0913723.1 unnamed protein product [Notodromas monacha]
MSSGRVLIYGGKGALGAACVSHFKSLNYWVGNIDLHVNEQADANVAVKPGDDWTSQASDVTAEVTGILEGQKLDAILCVAGGWAGGNVAASDCIKNADMMWKQSVWSSLIAAHIAGTHLKEGGLVAFCGAQPALKGTPGMIGYGMAKASVHQLVRSLAMKQSGLPANAISVAICPVTLDTPMNRKFMPNGDFGSWTPLDFVSGVFAKWTKHEDRPESGSLIQLMTKDGKTELVPAP